MLNAEQINRLTRYASDCGVDDSWKEFDASETWAIACIDIQKSGCDLDVLKQLYEKLEKKTFSGSDLYNFMTLFVNMLTIDKEFLKTKVVECKDIYDLGYELVLHKHANSKRTVSDRLSINDIEMESERLFLLAEGNESALHTLDTLMTTANQVNKSQAYTGTMLGHMIPGYNVMLSMDDMNIRGKQLVYAREFVDDDLQKLAKYMSDRNTKMLEYINYRSAQEYMEDIDSETPRYIAVESGASFTDSGFDLFGLDARDVIMNPFTAEMYLNDPVKPESIDYKSMDIVSHTDLETAKKIAEAWGFVEVCRIPRESNSGSDAYFFIMFNKKTGDFLEAPAATDDDICFGGCRVIACRDEVQRAGGFGHPGVEGNTENFYETAEGRGVGPILYECSYGHGTGIFSQYPYLGEWDISNVPFEDYPLRGMVSLPYPTLLNDYTFVMLERKLPEDLRLYVPVLSKDAYTISTYANLFVAAKIILENIPTEFQEYFSAVLTDKYKAFIKAALISIKDANTFVLTFKLAAAYTNMSEDECAVYVQHILDNQIADVARRKRLVANKGNDDPWLQRGLERSQDKLKDFEETHWMYDALDRHICHLADNSYPDADVSELPAEALSWMRTYGPETYKEYSDWGLYAHMRDQWFASNSK